jgi:hypothetical protein
MFPSTLFTGSSTNIQLSPSSSIAFWCSSSVSRRGWTSDHPLPKVQELGSRSFLSSELVSLPVCCRTILSPLYAHCRSICPSLCWPSALGSKLLSSGPTSQSVSVIFVPSLGIWSLPGCRCSTPVWQPSERFVNGPRWAAHCVSLREVAIHSGWLVAA